VPDDDPFSKVYDESASEFCAQFNPSNIKIFKGIIVTNNEALANRGKLIYTGNKQGCLVDTDGRGYKYAAESPS
jgi:hypothetical protein